MNACAEEGPAYIKIGKDEPKSPWFHPQDYRTWRHGYLCDPLYDAFEPKPDGMAFQYCHKSDHTQEVVEMRFIVNGQDSYAVEKHLVENFGMGPLKFVCCGWGTSGKYGRIESAEFRKIHPYLYLSVNMFSDEVLPGDDIGREATYFVVEVLVLYI